MGSSGSPVMENPLPSLPAATLSVDVVRDSPDQPVAAVLPDASLNQPFSRRLYLFATAPSSS